MDTAHTQINTALTPITEAFKKTTPGFIGLNLLLLAATYGLTYAINAFLAPINSPITSWLGVLLILATATTSFTLIATNALDRAEELDNSPLDALQNITAAIPITIYLIINTVILGITGLLFGQQALVPTTIFLLWPALLIIGTMLDRADEPIAAFKDGITNSLHNYALNAPAYVTIIVIATTATLLLIYAPVLLPPFLIYFLPFSTMIIATLYTTTP